MSKHNKKRNVGIIYELLLRYISNCLIENRKDDAQKALNIIEKRFKIGTELYKEFRIFNALSKSTVSGSHVASAILQEAKQACRNTNSDVLKKEKSALIKDINYKLNDGNFYYRSIPEYTTYATIQTLFNEWRKGDDSNFTKMIDYEKKISDWLITEKIEIVSENKDVAEHDALIFKIMSEKINEKYKHEFNDEQRKIIQAYAILNEEPDYMSKFLSEIKSKTVNTLAKFKSKNQNKFLDTKIDIILERINTLDTADVNDDLISKYLTVSKLKEEIQNG
jgi:hypothetical protein